MVHHAVREPRDNRNQVRRAIRFLVGEAGIRQLIDLGSGMPTPGNVHELAQAIDPSVRVVYVDNDPIVLTHGRALLVDETRTTLIQADVRDVNAIFDHPQTRRLVNRDEPFAVIAASIVHHLPDEEAYATAEAIENRLGPGCYFLVSNFLDDGDPRARQLERALLEGGLGTGRFRTFAEQQRFFDGLEMVELGLVYANDWRPDADTPSASPAHRLCAAGIGYKPA